MFTARNLYAHVWVANFGGTKSEFDQHWKTVSQGGGSSTGCLYSANAKGYKLLEIALKAAKPPCVPSAEEIQCRVLELMKSTPE
jgi:hypothetical protein